MAIQFDPYPASGTIRGMVFRIVVSLLALFTVVSIVFCEFLLTSQGLFDMRTMIYDALYDVLPISTVDTGGPDALLTALVYTLPECFAALSLYHIYALIGRSMGLAPSERLDAY